MLGKTHFSAFHSYGYLRYPKKSSALNRQLACAGWLTGDVTREPLRRKPRAIAISPAPNRWCYTAVITQLLVPKRSVLAG
jgi:hypothetical protein